MTKLLALARTWNETIKTVEDSGIFDDLDASEIQALDNLRTAIAVKSLPKCLKAWGGFVSY